MNSAPPRGSQAKPGTQVDEPVFWEPSVTFLKVSIAFLLAGPAVYAAVTLAIAPEQGPRALLALALVLVAGAAGFLLRRGRIKATVWTLGIGVWTHLAVAATFFGGVASSVILMHPMLILLAGWMVSIRAAVVVAVLSMAVTFGLMLAEMRGVLPDPAPTFPAMRWVIQVFVFSLTAFLIHQFVRAYRNRLEEVRGLGGELHQRGEELQESAADLTRAQAVAHVGSWVYELRSDTMRLSPETCRIFGLPEGTTGSREQYLSRVHAEDRGAVESAWQAALDGGVPFDSEHRVVVGDSTRWVRQRAQIVCDAAGKPLRSVGTTQDFTDRKRVEDALLLQSERLQIGQATARMIVMDWDVATDTIDWSDSPEWLRGPLPASGRYPLYKDQVHPDDLALWLQSRRDALGDRGGASVDYRLVRTDASVLWLHSRRTVIRGPDGKAKRLLVALHDITDRKRTEEALRASEARFRSLAELSSDWYWEQDADLRFVSTSGRQSDLGGLTADQHLGLRRWELPGNEIVGQSWDEHRAVLAARKPFRDLLLMRTPPGGEVHYVSVSGEPVFGAAGEFAGYRGVARDVTARVSAERQAREAGERLRSSIEHMSEYIAIMDAQDRVVVSNRGFRELNGNLPDGEPARTFEEHLRAGMAAGNYPQSLGCEEAWLAARMERHRRGDTKEVRRPDGQWLRVTDRRLPDGGMITIALDITEVKEAEGRLRAALENLGEMICLTDADDRIILANRRMIEFNAPVAGYLAPGRRYDEHLRAGIALGMFPDANGREDAWIAERMAYRRAPKGGIERRRQDGRWLLVDDQLLPDGGIISWGMEITERKRAEEALLDMNVALERRVAERTAQLEAANRELESFSYSVSHDLRAPLRAVTGFAKILLEKEGAQLSAEARRYLGIIDANGRRMGDLIDALLALGRYTRVALNKTEVDMARLAREACDELAPSWPGAQVDVGPLPPALGNATLLKQVFLNLIGNALKYSATGAAPRIEVRAEGGAYVVSDNGVGFDMAFADKLFRPFERLHSEREFQGTGIGLAIVKLIIERHGGKIEAHGAEGAGARFTFTIG